MSDEASVAAWRVGQAGQRDCHRGAARRESGVTGGVPSHQGGPLIGWKAEVGMEPMTGIEPAYSAWEADVLPLNYIGIVVPKG
jgi:hypothetical protein